MNLPHVFAKATTVADDVGYPITILGGSHWLASDPLVVARPDLFTEDPRYGLAYSGEPPPCMSVPPGEDDPSLANDDSSAAMTSRVRSRSPSARAQASA